MMRLQRTLTGAPIRLEQQLGCGGEGAVFTVHGHPNLVAKIYSKPPTPAKIEKLRAMARSASPGLLRIAAWPTDTLEDEARTVRGFIMPRVSTREDLHQLYSPKSRAVVFPDADFRFLVRTAANLARAFAQVHSQSHVIGDVNHGNALVGRDGTVVLIDCDSFQIRDRIKTHSCDVGVPLFTAPELQGKNFRGLRRSPNHDAFGLATLIFHLLFQGRHPFAGRYAAGEITIERSIAEHRFAYGNGNTERGMTAPPGTLSLGVFGPQISSLFVRAFAQPAASGPRPTAVEWVDALDGLEQTLVECETSPAHFHPRSARCCWCELEKNAGLRLFGRRLAAVARSAAIEVETIWSAIMGVPHPGPPPAPPTDPVSLTAREITSKFSGILQRVLNRVFLFGSLVSFMAILGGFITGQMLFTFAACVGLTVAFYPTSQRKRARKVALARASKTWAGLLKRWNQECSSARFDEALAQLRELRLQLIDLAQRRKQELDTLVSSRVQRARWKFLESFSIDELDSKLLTVSQRYKLVAFGVRTAADVDRKQADIIYLISARAAEELLAWYRMHLRSFDPPAGLVPEQSEIEAVQRRYDYMEERIARRLSEGPALLQQRHEEVQQARARLRAPLKTAWEALSRAQQM